MSEYTELFMTVILGLGVTFELPILVFFLALFGIVSAGWLWRNIRYAILVIFIISAIITPTPDVLTMCVFAAPMLVLYLVSIGVAYMVHPDAEKPAQRAVMKLVAALLCLLDVCAGMARAQAPLPRFDGDRALAYTREFVATGPRWVGSKGHAKAQAFLEKQFAKDDLVKDSFTASTPAGPLAMTNYIVKFPGSKGWHHRPGQPLRHQLPAQRYRVRGRE